MPRVPFRELFQRFYGLLEDCGIEYAAYGGVTVAVWGDPRETQDVDAVIAVEPGSEAAVLTAITSAGFSLPEDAAITFPIDGWLRASLHGRYADLAVGRTPFDESAMRRRQRRTLFGREIWVVTAEDLLLYKLIAYRRKDLADAESVVRRQRRVLDLVYLRHWAGEIASHTLKFEIPSKLEELIEEARGL